MLEARQQFALEVTPVFLNTSKSAAKERYLLQDHSSLIKANEIPDWDKTTPFPNKTIKSLEDLKREIELQKGEFPEESYEEAKKRVLRTLIMYSGISPIGNIIDYFAVDRNFPLDLIHPAVHLDLYGRSAEIRAIPPNWQDDQTTRTPLFGTQSPGNPKGLELWFDDGERTEYLDTLEVLNPVTPMRLAKKIEDKVVVNPIMICPLDCAFCIRTYTDAKQFGLVNYTPDETVNYLVELFGDNKWDEVTLIKFITGAFKTDEEMKSYLASFISALSHRTNGGFDPLNNESQGIHILTNLARTPEALQALKEIGVKSLEHSVELFDNQRRKKLMIVSKFGRNMPSKGDQSFDEMLRAAAAGVEVFGQDKYSIAIVMGLDDLETTISGMRALHSAGVREATTSIFLPNAYQDVELQQMTFSEIMKAKREAARLFALPDIFSESS